MTDARGDADPAELAFWRALAEERGRVIRALHEFNYWHESTVARGEVVAGLEKSVELWRERCLAAEARLDASPAPPAGGLQRVRRAVATRLRSRKDA